MACTRPSEHQRRQRRRSEPTAQRHAAPARTPTARVPDAPGRLPCAPDGARRAALVLAALDAASAGRRVTTATPRALAQARTGLTSTRAAGRPGRRRCGTGPCKDRALGRVVDLQVHPVDGVVPARLLRRGARSRPAASRGWSAAARPSPNLHVGDDALHQAALRRAGGTGPRSGRCRGRRTRAGPRAGRPGRARASRGTARRAGRLITQSSSLSTRARSPCAAPAAPVPTGPAPARCSAVSSSSASAESCTRAKNSSWMSRARRRAAGRERRPGPCR